MAYWGIGAGSDAHYSGGWLARFGRLNFRLARNSSGSDTMPEIASDEPERSIAPTVSFSNLAGGSLARGRPGLRPPAARAWRQVEWITHACSRRWTNRGEPEGRRGEKWPTALRGSRKRLGFPPPHGL